MKIKVSGCSIKRSKKILWQLRSHFPAISTHVIFWHPRQYVQGSFKKCEMYSANLPSHCKEYHNSLSQRLHSEPLMLNRGLITFTLLLQMLKSSRRVPGLNVTWFPSRPCSPAASPEQPECWGKEGKNVPATEPKGSWPHRHRHTFCLSSLYPSPPWDLLCRNAEHSCL